jgi:NADH-quinone oxidoreductase subunit J
MSVVPTFLQVLLPLLGFLVLFAKNPVHSVLFLILLFLNGAALFVLLGAEFLAMLLVVVYVGAVAVLFLFIVMMLNLRVEGFRQTLLNHYPLSVALLLFLFFGWIALLPSSQFGLALDNQLYQQLEHLSWVGVLSWKGNLLSLGSVLYTYYYFPFLLCSIILLVSMVGSILLTFQPVSISARRQQIYEQVVRSYDLQSFS